MATSPPLSSPSLSSNAHFTSVYSNGHKPAKPRTSDVSSISRSKKTYAASPILTPEVHINGRPRKSQPSTSSASTHTQDDTTWGSHFWVTLVDPQASFLPLASYNGVNRNGLSRAFQTQVSFFACPATGQVSWDPPVGNFVYVYMLPFLWLLPHGETAVQITAQRKRRMVGD
jgi:Rho GTPase-activating protein 39